MSQLTKLCDSCAAALTSDTCPRAMKHNSERGTSLCSITKVPIQALLHSLTQTFQAVLTREESTGLIRISVEK